MKQVMFAILFGLQRMMFWKKKGSCPDCGEWSSCYRFIHIYDSFVEYYRCPTCGKVIRIESLFE